MAKAGPGGGRRSGRAQLDPARRAAFDVLRAVSDRDAYANLALPALLSQRGMSGRDAAFATELTYGTCRTRGTLDAVIAAAAGRPVDEIDPVLLDLLRLGPTNCCAPTSLNTRPYPPLWSRPVSNSTRREPVSSTACCVPFPRATKTRGWMNCRRPWQPIRSGTSHSPMRIPVGSHRRSRMRWEPMPAIGRYSRRRRRPARCSSGGRPGVLTAVESADAVGGTVGSYSPYAVYLTRRRPRSAGPAAGRPERWCRTKAVSLVAPQR